MALVKFLTGSAADFQGLGTKNQDTLYFITDERRIYKGDVPFSGGIYSTVEEFPGTGVVNTLYVNTQTGEVAYWNGTSYQTVVPATGKTISDTGDDDHLATTKAVVDYVAAQVADLDVGALAGRVDTLETEMDTAEGNISTIQGQITVINGEGEGSIKKALSDAKAYTDTVASGKANAEHTHEIADVTGLQDALNDKADSADTLAGYGITDAYTKLETDGKIAEAVANADHLKREIVESLPEVGAADQHTIYMVAIEGGEGEQKYEEFMLINGAFEKIGDSAVDLTGYATETYVDQAETDAVNSAKSYTDTEVAEAITTSKSYANGLIAALDVEDAEVEGQYVSAVSETDGKITVSRKQLPAKPVIAEGATNGTISVDSVDVAVHGLKSAAYTDATDYATAAQGVLADSALQKADIVTGSANGTISVEGDDVQVKGLGSAAYTETSAYATAAQGTKADQAFAALTWGEI